VIGYVALSGFGRCVFGISNGLHPLLIDVALSEFGNVIGDVNVV